MYISGDSLLLGKHQLVPTLQELSLEEYRKEDEDFASLMFHVEKTSPKSELFLHNNPKVVQTVTLGGGSSERKDVLSKAWRLMDQAFQNICDLDIDE